MLNINYLVIKIFLALYLVIINVEYIYMCVHMCFMNLHVGEYLFSCFPCYLVLTMTASLFLSPILSFNKVGLLYLKLLPV